jgi:hypothetical protein
MNQDDWNVNKPGEDESDDAIGAMLAQLEIEQAPASLTRRLMRIPDEERAGKRSWIRWLSPGRAPGWLLAPAMAAIPLLVLAVLLSQPSRPSAEEVEQARHQLAIAFTYIDKAGFRTGHEIQAVLGDELRHSVKEPLSRHIPFTTQSHKEDST